MAQKVAGYIKLQIPAGKATPAPPVGPALGQHGVNIMQFTKEFTSTNFNDKSSESSSVSRIEGQPLQRSGGFPTAICFFHCFFNSKILSQSKSAYVSARTGIPPPSWAVLQHTNAPLRSKFIPLSI